MFRLRCSFLLGMRLSVLCFGFLSTCAFATPDKDAEKEKSLTLDIAPILEEANYERDDLFVILKDNRIFKALVQRYSIDDPAQWSTLRTRMGTRALAAVQTIEEAELMLKAKDTRSNLDGKLISAAKTRERGRAMLQKSQTKYREAQLVIDLINQLENKLKEVTEEKPLTGLFEIKNYSGKGFTGRVVMMDAQSAIIQMENGAYFRVPTMKLSQETKEIIEEAQTTEEAKDSETVESEDVVDSESENGSESGSEASDASESDGEVIVDPEDTAKSTEAEDIELEEKVEAEETKKSRDTGVEKTEVSGSSG